MPTSVPLRPPPTVELVVPVLNEAHVLEKSVETIQDFLRNKFPFPARILIADNGSSDGTGELAESLAQRFEDVNCLRIDRPGRGRALRQAWSQSEADIMAYTDVDISTELEALEKLCRAIWEQGHDLATGSRLMRESRVDRGFKREFISRCYNLLVRTALGTHFSDAQCGFKAVSREVARDLVPRIEDDSWFFDTELLVLAEKLGYSVKDVPVRWVDDDDSRVKIVRTALDDIKGVRRVRRQLRAGLTARPAATKPDTSDHQASEREHTVRQRG